MNNELKAPKILSNWLEKKLYPLLNLNTPHERQKMREKMMGKNNNLF